VALVEYPHRFQKLTTAELVARKPSPEEFAQWRRHPIHVVCDNIRSLMNVGLIFRLCDAALVERLYLCGITGYPPLPNDPRPPWVAERAERVIAKTAIRTVEYVPWEYRPSAAEVVRELKARGVQIVTLEQTYQSLDYTRAPYRFPLCLILGHEREGVEDEVLDLADFAVEIPMYGMGNSLNVAMAFGICVYEMIRCCLTQHGCDQVTAR
jgi:tRNA G18 (ribose-2'-O)-methylase SpoU